MKHFCILSVRRMRCVGDERPTDYEMFVSAPSKKAGLELLGISQSEFRGYGHEVCQEATIEEMAGFPEGTVLGRRYMPGGMDPNPLRAWNEIEAEAAALRAAAQDERTAG